jgi:hypothetical protein
MSDSERSPRAQSVGSRSERLDDLEEMRPHFLDHGEVTRDIGHAPYRR